MTAEVDERGQPGRRHETRDQGVEHDRRLLIDYSAVAKRACQHARRERNQGSRANDAKIDPVQLHVHLAKTLEHVVMIEPDHADVDEGDRAGEVRRQCIDQARCPGGLRARWAGEFREPAT